MSSRARSTVAALVIAAVAAVAPLSAAPAGAAPSRCTTSGVFVTSVTCAKQTTVVTNLGVGRDVHWQVPLGTPPAGGWPTVFMFQGSLFTAELNWSSNSALPFGALAQTRVVKALLDGGYAVVTPETHLNGSTFWDTNVPPFSVAWDASPDDQFMKTLFGMVDAGRFGPLNGREMFATGISSGGYMASRMTLAYPSRFRAIAIASASYASCSGPLCAIPALPAAHAPTLFMHGGVDTVVPIVTARAYDARLRAQGTPTRFVSETFAGHRWLASAPGEVRAWFDRYR